MGSFTHLWSCHKSPSLVTISPQWAQEFSGWELDPAYGAPGGDRLTQSLTHLCMSLYLSSECACFFPFYLGSTWASGKNTGFEVL